MRIPSVRTIRRLLIGVVVLVVLAVPANYLIVTLRKPAAGKAPTMLSSELKRSAEGVEIRISNGSELRFTVHARRLRETIGGKSHFEGIEAFDFNRDGSVRNSIHSEKAVYDPGRQLLDFSGDVRMSLEREIELRATSLHYDLNAEIGTVPGQVELLARNVSGRARDVRFFQKEERLELGGEVDFSLNPENASPGDETASFSGLGGAVHATASRGVFLLSENLLRFEGGVRIESRRDGELSGDVVAIRLNPDRDRITAMTALSTAPSTTLSSERVAYKMQDRKETRSLGGQRVDFTAGATGALDRILISGRANLNVASAEEAQSLDAGEIALTLDAATGGIAELKGERDVRLVSQRGDGELRASGDAIHAVFAEKSALRDVSIKGKGKGSARLSQSSRGATPDGGAATNELAADEIQARFRTGVSPGMDGITATGAVRWNFISPPSGIQARTLARLPEMGESDGGMRRTMTASKLEIRYASDAAWPESGEISGGTTLEETDAAVQLTRRLEARRMRFRFFPGVGQIQSLDAEQNVRIVYRRAAASTGKDAMVKVAKAGKVAGVAGIEEYETSSDRLEAFFALRAGASTLDKAAQWGNFRFRSDGRSAKAGRGEYEAATQRLVLTGAPEIAEAAGRVGGDRMEYDLDSKALLVHGGVRAVLGARSGGREKGGSLLPSPGGSAPIVVTSRELRHQAADGYFQFDGGVLVMTEGQQIEARELVIEGDSRMAAHGVVVHRILRSGMGGETSAPVESVIESEAMEYLRGDGTVRYSGKVSLKSKEISLSADMLDGLLEEDAKNLRSARASGNVVVRDEGRVVRGDAAEWDMASGRGVVTGDPAEIDDPVRGKSFARRLVYVQDKDRIVLE